MTKPILGFFSALSLVIIAILIASGALYLLAKTPKPEATTNFQETSIGTSELDGDWYSIRYPANFTAERIGNPTSDESSDEGIVTSPDGTVQFYVFSPRWSGEPSTYFPLQPLPNEIIESDESKTEVDPGKAYPQTVVRWVTYAAKDGSYKRSLVSTKTGSVGEVANFHLVFGIKYKDKASYDRYLKDYEAFKKSLVQYAD